MTARIWATLASDPVDTRPLRAGDLVCVEVPPNCTIHTSDAVAIATMRDAAAVLASGDWNEARRRDLINAIIESSRMLGDTSPEEPTS